jgi:hypothetical protein
MPTCNVCFGYVADDENACVDNVWNYYHPNCYDIAFPDGICPPAPIPMYQPIVCDNCVEVDCQYRDDDHNLAGCVRDFEKDLKDSY